LADIKGHYDDKAERARALHDHAAVSMFTENAEAAKNATARVRSLSGIHSILEHASFDDDAFEQRLDSVPHLLGVRNGVVDLRTGAVRPREPEDCVFTVLNMAYDPDAPTSCIDEVVLAITADDADKMRFLQRLLGYGVIGDSDRVGDGATVVFSGSGRNGKGLLLQTAQRILGDRFYSVVNDSVVARGRGRSAAHRFFVVDFPVFFTDLEPGEAPTKYRRPIDRGLKAKLQGPLAPSFLRWLVAGGTPGGALVDRGV